MRLPKNYAIGTISNGKRTWVKLVDNGGIEFRDKLTPECWVPKEVAIAWIKRPHIDPRYKLFEITANVNEYATKFRQRKNVT